ncbi:hypothetical protein HOO65_030936 [Ceratocystis lukuohia]|uniref:Uncharacterized protein n=1 Tax=Ceratocystis lukuohia TaxID=2019550 RepID=A0ABR4MMA5_9PEZI
MRKHRPYVMEMYNDVWSKPVDSQTNGYFTFAECKLLQEAGVGVQPSPKHLFAKEQDPIAAKATRTGKCKKSKSKAHSTHHRMQLEKTQVLSVPCAEAAPLAAQPAGNVISQSQTSFQNPTSEKPNKRARKRLRDIGLAMDNRRAEVHDIQTSQSQQDIVCALQQPAPEGKIRKTLTELPTNGKSTFSPNNHRKRETKRARKKARPSAVCSNLAKASPEEVAAAIAVTKARRALGEATAAALSARKAALLGIEHAKNARYQESAADILARRDVRSAEEYEKSVKQQNADAEKNLAEAKTIFQAAVAEEIRVKEAVLERSRAEKEGRLQNDAIPGPTQTQEDMGGSMDETDMSALEHDGAQYNPRKYDAGRSRPGEEAHVESLAKVEGHVGKSSSTQASDGETKHRDSYSHDIKSSQSREPSVVLHPPKSLSILSDCSSPLLRPRFMDIDIPPSTSLVPPASSAGTVLTHPNLEPKKHLQMSVECLEAASKGSRYSTPLFAQKSIQQQGHRFSIESLTRPECSNIQKGLDTERKQSAVSRNSVTAIFDLSSPASSLDVPVFRNFHSSGDRQSHVPQDLRNRQVLQPYEQKPAIPLIQGPLDSPMYSLCPPTHLDVTTIHPSPHQLQHQFNQYMVQMSHTSIGRPKSAFRHPLIEDSGPLPRSHHDQMMSEKMSKSPDRPSSINEPPVPSPRSTDAQAFTNRFLLDHRSQSATAQSNVVQQTSNGTLQEYGPKALCFQQSIAQDARPLQQVQHPGFQPTGMGGLTNGAVLVHSHGPQPLMRPAPMERANMSVQPAPNDFAPFFSRHRASSQSDMAGSTTPYIKGVLLDSHRQRLSANASPVPVPVHRNIFPKPSRSEIQSLSGSPRLPLFNSSVLEANISVTDADSTPSMISRDSQTPPDCRMPDEKALGMENTPPRDMRTDSCITSKEVLKSNSTSDKSSPSHFDFGLETSPSPRVSRGRPTDSSNDGPTTKRGRKNSYDSFYDISDDGRVDFSFLDAPELPQEIMDSVEDGENERSSRFFSQTPIPEAPRFNRESSIIMPSIEEQDVLEERSLWPTKGKFHDGARKPNVASKDFNMQGNHIAPPRSVSMAITNEMGPPPPHSKASRTSMAPAMIPRQSPMPQSFEPQDIPMAPPLTPRKTPQILPGETSPTTLAAVRRSPRRPAVFTPINDPSKATEKSLAGSSRSQISATTSRLPVNTRTAKKKGSPKKRGRQAQTPMRIFSEWERAGSEMPELMRPLMDSAKSFAKDLSDFVKGSPESTKKIGAELRVITKHLSKTKKIVKGAI